ncbi:MAG TPA: hypothetical protein VF189_01190 [Patescibacteria group bacterium]
MAVDKNDLRFLEIFGSIDLPQQPGELPDEPIWAMKSGRAVSFNGRRLGDREDVKLGRYPSSVWGREGLKRLRQKEEKRPL